MMLWIVLTLMIALVAAGLTIPLVRRYDLQKARGTALGVLRTQLGEVDGQLAAGLVSDSDAEALRLEIKRRILAEGPEARVAARPIAAQAMPWLALGLVAIVVLAATGLYALIGRPNLVPVSQAVPADAAANAQAAAHPMGDIPSMIAGLEGKLAQAPNNPEDWQMLGWSYMRTGRPADAAKAYGRAVALMPGNAEYLSAEAEALVQAADGKISSDAAALFRRTAAADPADPRARYYLAMYKDQQGDRDGAMADWITLLKSAPPGAPWAQQVRGFVENVAHQRGIDIAKQLPPAPAGAFAAPGPDAAQIAAAGQMSDSERQAMIHGMVDKLAAQLKDNPRDADGWVRLMRARMVLGEKDQAVLAYRDARKAFAGSSSEQAALQEAARALAIPN